MNRKLPLVHTDGIFWQSPDGHLVHISGWYNRVQVQNGDFEGAARQLGIDLASCSEGRYGKGKSGVAPAGRPAGKTGAEPWPYPFPPPTETQ